MRNIIGVRFKKLGKIYFFNPKYLHVVKGDKVIVETAQGEEIGNIIASDIETYLRKKEIIDIFDAFLGTLSERDRDIFVRRYWYMDSIKKIADRHNCGESRIKSILARSRKKLYYLLTEAGYAE